MREFHEVRERCFVVLVGFKGAKKPRKRKRWHVKVRREKEM
jgi:hypothetical protein